MKDIFLNTWRLIRLPNLIMICLIFYLTRFTLVKPILGFSETTSSINDTAYNLMVLAVILIAAGGYIINDWFDTGIDAINKPGKNKIGVLLSKRAVLITYIILNFIAFLFVGAFCVLSHLSYPAFLFLLCAGMLYFYSATYKKMFLVGNVVIALLSATTLWFTILFDLNAMQSTTLVILIAAYSIFAFMLTLVREMVKDCEDAAGDGTFGASTLPLIFGLPVTRKIAMALTLIVFASLLYVQVSQQQWENKISFYYVVLFIQLPLLVLSWKLFKARDKHDDSTNSMISKIVMLTGILSMFVFYITSI